MKWDEFQVGDIVETSDDLLLVIYTSSTKHELLGLDIQSELTGALNGVVEVWDRMADRSWESVARDTRLVLREERQQE